MTEERTVLADGCFWGVQDLVRRYAGVLSTRVAYTGANVPHSTYRNHGMPKPSRSSLILPASAIDRSSSFSSRFMTPARAIARATTSGPAIGRQSSTPVMSRGGLPKTRSPTSILQAYGPTRSLLKSFQPVIFGRPNPSIGITSNEFQTAIPVISSDLTGGCRFAPKGQQTRTQTNKLMKSLNDTPLSMLDLVPIREDGTVADALAISLKTAQHAESLGFKRYWLAEHHNMPGITSSATAVLVGYIAGGTQRIRVGSGGLGSSLFSARLAAERGLPYAFASHFAPRLLHQAITLYRSLFCLSESLAQPYVMISVPLIAAPNNDEAEFLASTTYQRVLGILRGDRRSFPPPVEDFMSHLSLREWAAIGEFLSAGVIGDPDTVISGLTELLRTTTADELMLVCDIYDPALRLRSFDIVTEACGAHRSH